MKMRNLRLNLIYLSFFVQYIPGSVEIDTHCDTIQHCTIDVQRLLFAGILICWRHYSDIREDHWTLFYRKHNCVVYIADS